MFPPLTARQRILLEEIEGLKKALEDFHGLPAEIQPPELATLLDIDKLTAKALRSGLVKRDADGDWRLHPELPPLARKYSREWILTRRALGDRKSLRKARIGRAATPEQLAALRLACLEKEIALELILQEWQVSGLEELDYDSAQRVKEWLERQ